MDFYEYNDMVQQWVSQVLENTGKNAELTLKYCRDIIEYGEKNTDHKLIGFGYYYMGETYYGLNDGAHFFEVMGKALSNLNQAEEWEYVARCYNYLGITAMNRGNAPIALDYYLNGLNYCRAYNLLDLTVLFQVNLAVLNISCGRYEEAQTYLEKAAAYVRSNTGLASYHRYMFCIYSNLIKTHVMQENLNAAKRYLEIIHREHWEYGDTLDHLAIYCNETIYYHRMGLPAERDACIGQLDEILPENLTILDMFDDFYDYCLVLLEAERDESFWHVIETMEPLIKDFSIINLHLRVISLKMKYYRKYGENAEYLKAAGLHYELSELMENETRSIINNMINMRRNLEWVNRAKEKVEKENRILQEKSEMDSLTRIANRSRLNDYSDSIFTHADDNSLPLTVEILDVDYFKEYNDNYGHQAGDNCLRRIAAVLKGMADENDGFCARYGGDEFVMIYEGKNREQAVALAGETKKRVMDLEMEHAFSRALPIVTVSQGLCWGIPQDKTRMWDFMHAADDMLYRVKKLSRNNYCVGDVQESGDVVIGVTGEL